MTQNRSARTFAVSVALAAMLSVPTLAHAQMAPMPQSSTPMDHEKMMPMGKGHTAHGMQMPNAASPKKPGCCGKTGMEPRTTPVPKKRAKPQKHPAKIQLAPAKPAAEAPMAQPMSGHMEVYDVRSLRTSPAQSAPFLGKDQNGPFEPGRGTGEHTIKQRKVKS